MKLTLLQSFTGPIPVAQYKLKGKVITQSSELRPMCEVEKLFEELSCCNRASALYSTPDNIGVCLCTEHGPKCESQNE